MPTRFQLVAIVALLVSIATSPVFAESKTATTRPMIASKIKPPVAPPYDSARPLGDVDSATVEWKDETRDRAVPAKIYFSKVTSGQPLPVILFSHGLGGSRDGYEYLGQQWAANGYVVIHVQHVGSDSEVLHDNPGQKSVDVLRHAANKQNSIDRAKDVRFAIDQLASIAEKVPALRDRLDLERVGVGGHSYGANTTMLVAGQKLETARKDADDLSDPRVKAALAMSEPVNMPAENLDADYAGVKIPVMMMTGTEDDSPIGETKAADRRLPFDHLKCPAWLLILNGGDHLVFSGRRDPRPSDDPQQKLIRLCSTAFWDAVLKNDAAAKQWLASSDGFQKQLGAAGTFERKP